MIDVLRKWPQRADGQWWPTWHDVEAVLRAHTSLRQAIINHLMGMKTLRLAENSKPMDPDTRAKVAAMFDGLKNKIGIEKRHKMTIDDWEECAKREALEDLEILKDQPVRVSAALIEKLKGA